jgi:uncharacterized membrane protein
MSIPQDRGHPLSEDYIHPQHRISALRSIGRRLRRNYGALFGIQALAYFAKISIHPADVTTWAEFFDRAHIGQLPGWVCIVGGLVFHVVWISIAVVTWLQDKADHTRMADYLVPDLD